MAARRGKSQARRRGGNQGMPGWAWMVLGIVLAVAAILLAPRFFGKDDGDGFFRPRPNPDAQPAPVALDGPEVAAAPETRQSTSPRPDRADDASDAAQPTQQFDFYTVLPGQEVVMSDAQIAAAAREERARQERERRQQLADAATQRPQAIDATATPASPATPPRPETAPTPSAPSPAAASAPAAAAPAQAASAGAVTSDAAAARNDTPYILQAGAFQASGDAEALKARIALLGLNARVESAQISGKTVYRVRMGPYASASELAEAKGKLSSGGLPAMAIQAR